MFLWDAANIGHIARHGISPEEAEQVIGNKPLDLQRQLRNSEERVLHLGETATGRILFVVITPRGHDLRVVTAFPADKGARAFYASEKGANDAKNNRDS